MVLFPSVHTQHITNEHPIASTSSAMKATVYQPAQTHRHTSTRETTNPRGRGDRSVPRLLIHQVTQGHALDEARAVLGEEGHGLEEEGGGLVLICGLEERRKLIGLVLVCGLS